MIADWLDSNGVRAVGYGVAGAASMHAGRRERARSVGHRSVALWPAFWFITGCLLIVMALGRALEIDELVTEFGRSQARVAGWYRTRRGLQAALVGSVSAIWLIAVFVAIWRVPERRRRYLPMALVVFTMSCFAAIRLVSLHHADAVLYNRTVVGVRVVAVVEWSLLGAAILATFWNPFVLASANRPTGHDVAGGTLVTVRRER